MSDRSRPKKSGVLDFLIICLVVAIIIAHPTSWTFSPEEVGKALGFAPELLRKAPRLTIVDVLIWIASALLLLKMIVRRNFRCLRTFPVAAAVLVALAAASITQAQNKLPAIADVIQFVEYFILLFLLIADFITNGSRLRLVVLLWLTVGTAVVLWGFAHYLSRGDYSAVQVAGPFLNRNVLGGYLAILIPLAWGLMLHVRKIPAKFENLLLAAVGLLVMLAGGPWIAAVIGIGLITVIRSPKLFPAVAFVLLAVVLFAFPLLPRNNSRILVSSVNMYDEEAGQISPRYAQWQACVKALTLGNHETLGMKEKDHVRQLLLGVGIGNFQENVGRYYGSLPKQNKNTMEPNSQNLYLVMGLGVGIPAVLAFLWLVGTCIGRTAVAYRKSTGLSSGILLGCMGALVSLLIANLFTETLVHGTGPAMILLFAVSTGAADIVERESLAGS